MGYAAQHMQSVAYVMLALRRWTSSSASFAAKRTWGDQNEPQLSRRHTSNTVAAGLLTTPAAEYCCTILTKDMRSDDRI